MEPLWEVRPGAEEDMSIGDGVCLLLNEMDPDVECDCGAVCQGEVSDDEITLTWDCPKCGPMSDTNV